MKILFVCAANITRSFMAERILKNKLAKNGRHDIEVASAALSDMKEAAADPSAVDILKKNGFSADGHKSRLLTADMVNESDMIIVMEKLQKELIARRYPGSDGKLFLLKSFSRDFDDADQDIRDCFNRSSYHYRLCLSEICLSVEGLMKCI
ncbi:MAG: low molecular weight phosphotyrosine protein phosphatase [Syntrophales bacterium]